MPITDVVTDEIDCRATDTLPEGLLQGAKPLILRNYISDWPIVIEAKKSNTVVMDYLKGFYNGKPVHVMKADAKFNGRLFYNNDITDFNFTRHNQNLLEVFSILRGLKPEGDDTYYVGSTAVDSVLPGLRAENDLAPLKDQALVSIWLGNQSRVAAHHDAPDNIACVVAGKRRFTMFPAEQVENLYIGPLDYTPAGQSASLVDFANPDFERFPKFKKAMAAAQVAELNPGDALYVPSMWWHHVEALSEFNILINYWWRQVENFIGVPADALTHAILSIRELPEAQREAWRKMFEYYVFDPQQQDHIPENRRGMLNPIDARMSRQLRATLLNKLNR